MSVKGVSIELNEDFSQYWLIDSKVGGRMLLSMI